MYYTSRMPTQYVMLGQFHLTSMLVCVSCIVVQLAQFFYDALSILLFKIANHIHKIENSTCVIAAEHYY